MGWSRKRTGLKGQVRYTAYYRDARGKTTAAGTFSSKRDADKAWRMAEVRQAEGRVGDPRRGRQTFRQYVEGEWLPHHVMEITTREGYTYSIGKHILPWFGPMRMNQIMPSDVREWVATCTVPSAPTTRVRVGVLHARQPSRPTEHAAGPAARTNPGCREPSTLTGTFPGGGSVSMSGGLL